MLENTNDFVESARALAPGFRLVPQEIGVVGDLFHQPASAAVLRSTLDKIEFLAAHLHRFRRTDACPNEAIAYLASLSTHFDWKQHVIVSLLSARWNGDGELAIVRSILNSQVEILERGAAA